MTIKGFKDRFDQFYSSLNETIQSEVAQTSDVLLDLNRDQMLYGRDAKGEVLTPAYLDDPYFRENYKSPLKAAIRYKNYKKALEDTHWGMIRYIGVQLFPDKSEDTPNLIINGNWFMNYLFINVSGDQYTIGSTGIAADSIQKKYEGYGHPVFGLAPVSKEYYYRGWIRPAILNSYKKHLQ